MRKFIWIGYDREQKYYRASEPMDTDDMLRGNYPPFFSLENRDEEGSCRYIGAVSVSDMVHFQMESGECLRFMLDIDSNGKMMLLGEEQFLPLDDMLARADIAEVRFSVMQKFVSRQ